MKRNNIAREIFIGIGGEISSKRVMMFLSFCMMITMAIFSTIYSMKVEQFIFDGFLYIVVGGLFSVASEKFSNAFKKVDGEKSETSNS
jgi:high-affinity Fe2+/Pb2+ permease